MATLGHCINISHLLNTQQYKGGGWMQHSWIVDKDGLIVESTNSDTYPQYFGIEHKSGAFSNALALSQA